MTCAAKRKDDQLADMMARLDAKDTQIPDLIVQITTWNSHSGGRRNNNDNNDDDNDTNQPRHGPKRRKR